MKYFMRSGETWVRDGRGTRRIANFVAQIRTDIVVDDGLRSQRRLELVAALNGRTVRFTVPAGDFQKMLWVVENLGGAANIAAGSNNRDHVRAAIQQFSPTVQTRSIFPHTGFRKIGGRCAFLHGGGAVGVSGVETDLQAEGLGRYVLPTTATDIVGAVKLSVSILEIARPTIAYAAFGTIYRAPTAHHVPVTTMQHWVGTTGLYKTTLAAVLLAHFGAFRTKEDMPARWAFTETVLEKDAFLAKDVPLVIDDFNPEAVKGRREEMEKRFSRIIGAVGDNTGRRRSSSTLETRLEYYPRGLVLSTGEYIPELPPSRLARLLPVPFESGSIFLDRLTGYQKQLSILPNATVGYVEYLAKDFDSLGARLRERFEQIRADVSSSSQPHARLAENVAHIQLGIEQGLDFALSVGAMSQYDRDRHVDAGLRALVALAEVHGRSLQQERPTQVFVTAVREELAADRAFLADPQTGAAMRGNGYARKLGWIDNAGVYLLPQGIMRLVNGRLNYRGGVHTSDAMLKRALKAEGYLLHNPSEADRLDARKWFEKGAHRVLWLRPDVLDMDDPA